MLNRGLQVLSYKRLCKTSVPAKPIHKGIKQLIFLPRQMLKQSTEMWDVWKSEIGTKGPSKLGKQPTKNAQVTHINHVAKSTWRS